VPFWRRARQSSANVEAVSIDMSATYIEAVSTHLSEAAIVFDPFHVIKLFNEKLSQLRRDLYREATEQLHKDVLKGTRWLGMGRLTVGSWQVPRWMDLPNRLILGGLTRGPMTCG